MKPWLFSPNGFFSLIVSLTEVRRFAGREVEDERETSGITGKHC
jgi:hypothetical protein